MFSLWRKARRENSVASRLLGTTSLRFALHGWQRRLSCCARWISVSGRRNHFIHFLKLPIFLNWQSNNDLFTPFFYHNWFYSRGIDKAAEAVLCIRLGY